MDVSKREEPGGQELLEEVVSLTGLPQPWVETELNNIVETAGHKPGEVTLDQLRAAMLTYLQSMEADLMAEESASPIDAVLATPIVPRKSKGPVAVE